MELNLTKTFFGSVTDLGEGIRAKLIDKTNDPKWTPSTLEDVQDEQVESIFSPSNAEKLTFINPDQDFASYPINYALPNYNDIQKLVQDNNKIPREALIEGILEKRNHKMGLEQKLRHAFDKHVHTNEHGHLQWRK